MKPRTNHCWAATQSTQPTSRPAPEEMAWGQEVNPPQETRLGSTPGEDSELAEQHSLKIGRVPPQKWTTLRSLSLFLAKIPQHKNSRWGSRAGHRQTFQMVHPRGYEAQKTEPNLTSTASPKTVSVKPENPAGRAEGWSPESTGPEKGALHSLPPLRLHQTSHSA